MIAFPKFGGRGLVVGIPGNVADGGLVGSQYHPLLGTIAPTLTLLNLLDWKLGSLTTHCPALTSLPTVTYESHTTSGCEAIADNVGGKSDPDGC
jgi:hypothetical protein